VTLADDLAGVNLPKIEQPYLLVLFSVPFYIDDAGRRWIEALWAKDLEEHARYISRLTLAAPAIHGSPPPSACPMDELDSLRTVRCVDLPVLAGVWDAPRWLARTCAILWREIGRTHLVHSAVAGWPIPEAWLLVPMLSVRRRWLYINVESAFWRLVPGEKVPLRRRLQASVSEFLNKRCLARSDVATFTHRGYRDSLLGKEAHRGHVVEASWIDERHLLDDELASQVIRRRNEDRSPFRIVFVGRLSHAKGVSVLLEAVEALIEAGVDVRLDLFGQGPLQAEFEARSCGPALSSRVTLRGVLPYGDEFFAALRNYHVLVVPTLSDEQPRVVYDAYSQGLPVIASRTDGLSECIEHGVTGLLCEPGNADSLRQQIERVFAEPALLVAMSRACLSRARRTTHQHIHRRRWRLLLETIPSLATDGG